MTTWRGSARCTRQLGQHCNVASDHIATFVCLQHPLHHCPAARLCVEHRFYGIHWRPCCEIILACCRPYDITVAGKHEFPQTAQGRRAECQTNELVLHSRAKCSVEADLAVVQGKIALMMQAARLTEEGDLDRRPFEYYVRTDLPLALKRDYGIEMKWSFTVFITLAGTGLNALAFDLPVSTALRFAVPWFLSWFLGPFQLGACCSWACRCSLRDVSISKGGLATRTWGRSAACSSSSWESSRP